MCMYVFLSAERLSVCPATTTVIVITGRLVDFLRRSAVLSYICFVSAYVRTITVSVSSIGLFVLPINLRLVKWPIWGREQRLVACRSRYRIASSRCRSRLAGKAHQAHHSRVLQAIAVIWMYKCIISTPTVLLSSLMDQLVVWVCVLN